MCTLKPNHERDTRRPLFFGDDFLRIFLPMIDDEEQRRLEKLEEEEEEQLFNSLEFTERSEGDLEERVGFDED